MLDFILINFRNMIILLGVLTFLLMITTVFSGLRRWKLKRHRTIALCTLTCATLHGILVFIMYFVL